MLDQKLLWLTEQKHVQENRWHHLPMPFCTHQPTYKFQNGRHVNVAVGRVCMPPILLRRRCSGRLTMTSGEWAAQRWSRMKFGIQLA